jgi:hypothetical protein
VGDGIVVAVGVFVGTPVGVTDGVTVGVFVGTGVDVAVGVQVGWSPIATKVGVTVEGLNGFSAICGLRKMRR